VLSMSMYYAKCESRSVVFIDKAPLSLTLPLSIQLCKKIPLNSLRHPTCETDKQMRYHHPDVQHGVQKGVQKSASEFLEVGSTRSTCFEQVLHNHKRHEIEKQSQCFSDQTFLTLSQGLSGEN